MCHAQTDPKGSNSSFSSCQLTYSPFVVLKLVSDEKGQGMMCQCECVTKRLVLRDMSCSCRKKSVKWRLPFTFNFSRYLFTIHCFLLVCDEWGRV